MSIKTQNPPKTCIGFYTGRFFKRIKNRFYFSSNGVYESANKIGFNQTELCNRQTPPRLTRAAFFFEETQLATLLVIDNYDSFTHNLVQMLMLYDLEIEVFRSDRISIDRIARMGIDYILISPGPKDPAHAGISTQVVSSFAGHVPILGVCLGMQCINEAMGGSTVNAPIPVHGKTSRIHHHQEGIFKGIPSPFTAARYHSLMVDPKNTGLEVTARSDDGVIMGLHDLRRAVFGVQGHPESFMTQYGFVLIENFLKQGPLKKPSKRVKRCG